MTCIAILLGAPLSPQNLERIGIPYLAPHFDLVVLDCLPWLGRSDAGHAGARWEPLERISSEDDLAGALALHKPLYALDFIGLGPLTPCIQRVLARAGTAFVVQKSGSLPLPSLFQRLAWRTRIALERKPTAQAAASVENESLGTGTLPLKSVSPIPAPGSAATSAARTARDSLPARLARKLRTRASLLAPDLALLAGKESRNAFTRKSRQILWTGSQDYHLYQAALGSPQASSAPRPYAVFVDDNLPFASDWPVLGLEPPVTPQEYYPSMRRFFDAIEAAWQMPVVIAGHPSGRSDKRVQQGFGGRSLHHGQTPQLVQDASAVLLHGSTAVSFAVLGNKPLMFLTTRQLRRVPYGLHVHTLALRLGQKPLDIDGPCALPPLASLAPRSDLWRRYVEDFLRAPESHESSPWQAFIEHARLQPANCPAAAPAGRMTGSQNAR